MLQVPALQSANKDLGLEGMHPPSTVCCSVWGSAGIGNINGLHMRCGNLGKFAGPARLAVFARLAGSAAFAGFARFAGSARFARAAGFARAPCCEYFLFAVCDVAGCVGRAGIVVAIVIVIVIVVPMVIVIDIVIAVAVVFAMGIVIGIAMGIVIVFAMGIVIGIAIVIVIVIHVVNAIVPDGQAQRRRRR